jgi:hypothetical protein
MTSREHLGYQIFQFVKPTLSISFFYLVRSIWYCNERVDLHNDEFILKNM